ncbi:unnamed protein product [Phytophthora fragariaefolia]|uniref:RxLR effector protein n=1 Tax=Phytophthora fragariaefolia TaxID=1490495 RepID=A0A9W6Y413_9STRA|nr:unnamed protein product [Phytophthora fragariaefolia]
MRLPFIFLMAAVAMVATSTAISTEQPHSLSIGDEKRFLRSYKTTGDDGDDGVEEAEDRRGGANLFALSKLNEMESSVKTFKRFKNWKDYGYTPRTLNDALKSRGVLQKYKGPYEMYHANYYTI